MADPVSDPTHGRIDEDIQRKVDAMNPRDLGSRVAMENTLQDRRNRGESIRLRDSEVEVEIYIRMPTLHEACQLPEQATENELQNLAKWCGGTVSRTGPLGVWVDTLHGEVLVRPGQWIVKGERDFWPVEGQQFADTYVRIEDDDAQAPTG